MTVTDHSVDIDPRTLPGRRPALSRWHVTAALQIADIIVITLFVVTAFIAFPATAAGGSPNGNPWLADAVVMVIALYLSSYTVGAYHHSRLRRPIFASLAVICPWIAVSGSFMLITAGGTAIGREAGVAFLAWLVGVICAVSATRFFATYLAKRLYNTGRLAHTICIIGGGAEAAACVRYLLRQTDYNLLLGYFLAGSRPAGLSADLAYLGHVDELAAFVRRERVDEIIVATPASDRERLNELILDLRCVPVVLSVWPETLNLPEQSRVRNATDPLLSLGTAPLSGWSWVVKDIQDRTIAAIMLIVCLPVLLAISAAILLSSPGPVFFRQMREGYCGREFRIFKFRTMHVPVSAQADRLVLTAKRDSRIFPFGALLRRTSLDELPQLFNVLRGDMWLIGPRPHSPLATVSNRLYADAVPRYAARHKIKPGITGWAQINGWRGPTSTIEQIEQRVAHDLYYIDHWSPLLDLRILLMTALRGFVHRNAY